MGDPVTTTGESRQTADGNELTDAQKLAIQRYLRWWLAPTGLLIVVLGFLMSYLVKDAAYAKAYQDAFAKSQEVVSTLTTKLAADTATAAANVNTEQKRINDLHATADRIEPMLKAIEADKPLMEALKTGFPQAIADLVVDRPAMANRLAGFQKQADALKVESGIWGPPTTPHDVEGFKIMQTKPAPGIPRKFTTDQLKFDTHFHRAPRVLVSLTTIDSALPGQVWNCEIAPVAVSTDGFSIFMETNATPAITHMRVSWIAIGP